MPNIKSAKKRVLVNKTKAAKNKATNSALKTAIKKAQGAIDELINSLDFTLQSSHRRR